MGGNGLPTGWQKKTMQALLYWESRPARLRRLVRRAVGPAGTPNVRHIDPTHITLAAVQMRAEGAADLDAYILRIVELAQKGAAAGAQIMVFPEYTAVPLLGTLTGLQNGVRGEMPVAYPLAGDNSARSLLQVAGRAVLRVYTAIFSELAAALGLYIHAGSAVLPGPGGRFFNTAYMFNPSGRLLATQAKVHLLPQEAGWGIVPGQEITVAETVLGRVGLPLGPDALDWEYFRILYLQGADFTLVSSAWPQGQGDQGSQVAPGLDVSMVQGLWGRIQESPMFALQSSLVGEVVGTHLAGRTGIYGPCSLSPGGDGILAVAPDPRSDAVVTAPVNIQALYKLRAQVGLEASFNPYLYERYLPHLYHRLAERRKDRKPGRTQRRTRTRKAGSSRRPS